MRARALAAALALSVLTACCATGVVAQRPYPAPEADALFAGLRARQQAVRSVDLDTRTTSWLGGDRANATVVMLVERSGRLRFEAEVSLQGAVASLVTSEDHFALLDLQKHVFKRGDPCPANVASLIPVPLVPREVAALLLGDAPLSTAARPTGAAWDGRAGAGVLSVDNGAGGVGLTDRLWVSLRRTKGGDRFDVVAVEGETAARRGRWRVAYDDLEVEGGIAYPRTIRFAEPGKSFDDGVEIKVKNRRVNATFKDQAFQIAPPEGYPVEVVPCCPECVAPK